MGYLSKNILDIDSVKEESLWVRIHSTKIQFR
jgi:hypothetical protein